LSLPTIASNAAVATSENRANACDRFARRRIRRRSRWRIEVSVCALLPAMLAGAQESTRHAPDFLDGDIRVEGLQRISEGTVYNYLPVNIGDALDSRRIREAIRALCATGFFQDVELRRDRGTLIVAVLERPTIERFEIKGNKDVSTADLQRSLRNVGLAPGKSFDRSVLDEVERYLTEQ